MRLLPALLAAALLLAGCAAPPPPAPPPPAPPALLPAHEHASFGMFLHGEPVRFNHTDYDRAATGGGPAFLRVADPDGGHIVHLEGAFPGGVPNVTLGAFLATLGVSFELGGLTLDTRDGHNGTTWNETRGVRWQVWVQERDSGAQPRQNGPDHVLGEGQRVLLSFAPPGFGVFDQLQRIPEPPRNATG